MSPQTENIKNPLLREFAEKTQHMSKGDFGMTIYGGVDLEAYAELIIRECRVTMSENFHECRTASLMDKKIKEHFGIKE